MNTKTAGISSGLVAVAVINVNGADSCSAVLTKTWALPVGSYKMVRLSDAEEIIAAKGAEIERLKKRVNQGIVKANKVIAETNRIIQAIPKSVMESAHPGHPRNVKENGTLSKRGVECVFQLFEAQATPLAAAYLMRISQRSATHWFAKWKASKA